MSRSVDISPDGSFSFFDVPVDSVDLIIDEKDTSNRKFFPALIALTKPNFLKARVVRIPVEWEVVAGIYSGESVDISLELAYVLDVAGPMGKSFFLRNFLPERNSWSYTKLFMNVNPVPVGFDRPNSNAPISPADSTAFWTIVDSVEGFWGRDLFSPANLSDLQPWVGIRISVDTSLQGTGFAGFHASLSGEIYGGSIVWKSEDLLSNFVSVSHELQHNLGFGHTCSWPTLMFNFCPNELKIPYPTLHDVAYGTLFHLASKRAMEGGASYGIPEAHQGQRVLMLGLPREIIRY